MDSRMLTFRADSQPGPAMHAFAPVATPVATLGPGAERRLRRSSKVPTVANASRRSSSSRFFCRESSSYGADAAWRSYYCLCGRSSEGIDLSACSGKKSYAFFDRRRSKRRPSAVLSNNAEQVADDDEEAGGNIGMSILKLALPALGIVLSDPLMSVIDTGCVGQLSSIQLAALGPNTLVFNFVFQVFSFLGITTTNFVASSNVKAATPDEQQQLQVKASRVLSQALCLAAILGLTITGLLEIIGEPVLKLLGAGPDYIQPALTYLRIRALSVPAVLMLLVGFGACLGRQNAKTPLLVNAAAASVNLVLDLVFALWAGWGVIGAAWATVVSQYIALFFLLRALNGESSQRKANSMDRSNTKWNDLAGGEPGAVTIGWFGLPSQDVLGPFYTMASSLMLRYLLGMVVYTSLGKVAAQVGTLSIASHQVAMQVFWFLSFFPEALAVAAQSLVARDLTRNRERARAVARKLLFYSLAVGSALSCAVAMVHYLGISLLTADKQVANLVRSVTKQSMLCEMLCAIANVIESIAIASGDMGYLSRMQQVNLGGMLIALISSYRAGWGLAGVWWCFVLFFGFRVVYHAFHISAQWQTHLLGSFRAKVQVT